MKKYIIIGAALVGFAIAGCRKSYLDINQNPNDPTEASISADLILPNSQARMAILLGATSTYRPLNHWTGQWVRGGDFGANAAEEQYDLPTTFGQGLWTTLYDILQDVNTMETKATASGSNFYIGAAKVLKVEGFRQLVDMYNNVPYSKAFDLGGNILPAYDKGQDIYIDLFKQLDQAIVAFNADVPGQSVRTNIADIMFFGNTTKWKQYVNTLRLKLILRLTEVGGIINVADQMAKMTADGYIPSGGTAFVQPGYIVTAGKLNPFWNFYKTDENNIEADKFNRANPYALTLLRNSNDIRFQYYFSKAKSPTGGQDYRAGDPYGSPVSSGSGLASDAQSNVAGPGLAKTITQAQWVLTSIESQFLQAEAIHRTYIVGGTAAAKAKFDEGIKESFIFLGVPNAAAEANTLITSGDPAYTYTGGAGGIKTIIEQKYRSLIGMSAFDIYSDYRRTGFPVVPLSLNASRLANVPVRYPYPANEYNFNSANAAAQGTINPITTNVFWDK